MIKTSSLAEIAPDLALAGAALERAARNARRLADKTNTPFYVFIDGKIVDLRKLEQESHIESTSASRVSPASRRARSDIEVPPAATGCDGDATG